MGYTPVLRAIASPITPHAGYMGGEQADPRRVGTGDGGGNPRATRPHRVQARDRLCLAALARRYPLGIRGAVPAPGKGRFSIGSALKIRTSGVVLRGQGEGTDGTVLVATGIDRRTLIQVSGNDDRVLAAETPITDTYVPVNAMTLQ